jgi:hypothetical protein
MLDPRDINRDAKWRRLVMKEVLIGAVGASQALQMLKYTVRVALLIRGCWFGSNG